MKLFCHCCTPDGWGNYDPCCNNMPCEAPKEANGIDNCIHCGSEMFEENGFWFHHSQDDIPFEERKPQWKES